ncbi:TPA: hypothetical protein HA265_07435 [Candidatus Woesearchaeota archaeon]|nr:hypothetical protein [Candidatus Woesearchaeota archaeon]
MNDRREVLKILGAVAGGAIIGGAGACAPEVPKHRYIITPPRGSEALFWKMLPEARTYSALKDSHLEGKKLLERLTPLGTLNGEPVYEAGAAFLWKNQPIYVFAHLSRNIRGNPVLATYVTAGITLPTNARGVVDGLNDRFDGVPEGSVEVIVNSLNDMRCTNVVSWKPTSDSDRAKNIAYQQNAVGNLMTAYVNGKF